MLKPRITVDYSMFESKMGRLGTKVIPYARIQAQMIAKYGLKAVRIFTLRAGNRTPGRIKIADLWQLTHDRKATMDIYTIENLYPNQDVIVIFEKGARRHEIRPRTKSWMRWESTDTGEEIFAKHVDHPGVKGSFSIERTEKEIINPRVEIWMRETLAMVDKVVR